MKRPLALALAVSSLVLVALPAGAAASKRATYALEGEARGLELAIGDQGVTLGLALARGSSTPIAEGVGAGQCSVLGDEADPDNLPCNESTTQKSVAPGEANAQGEICAGPAIPAPLDSVLTIDVACGSSVSAVRNGTPSTSNSGKVAEVGLGLDLTGLIPQAEDAKEQLIDQLQSIIGGAPEPIATAVNQLLDAIDEGQGAQIVLGPAASNITSKGDRVTVTSTSAGALIGVAGIPDLNKDGIPIPGSSVATEDGLIIVEVGKSFATASVDKLSAASDSDSTAALVTVKVRDITKVEPTYTEVPVAPGQTVTILEGTPAESTITAAVATKESREGSAVAAADAVRLHLLKGVSGGVKLGLARATAAVTAKPKVLGQVNDPDPRVLPMTGARDATLIALGLLILAGAAFGIRRRVN
ncbi:MAG TPA: LPXTG cell wall anchor domain-containing protein [Actinomycetota bacterium]|nr:LPXTG cell wall anchor domain-containing protein [Actinomycetota bacterium]